MDKSFHSFMERLIANEQQSWWDFRQRYARICFNLVRGQQNIDWEDIFQEVCARLVANNYALLKRFRYGGEAGFCAWLAEISRRVMHEILRANKKQHELFEFLVQSFSDVAGRSCDPYEILSDKLAYQEFLCAWRELPHIKQQVVLLVLDGFKHHEIAVKLAIPQNTSLSHYNRAIRYLQQRLGLGY